MKIISTIPLLAVLGLAALDTHMYANATAEAVADPQPSQQQPRGLTLDDYWTIICSKAGEKPAWVRNSQYLIRFECRKLKTTNL